MADDVVVGILRTLLHLDTALFESGAKKATSATKGIEDSVVSVGKKLAGAFTATAIVAYGREVLKFADDIGDLSDQTGISATRLQALNYAFAGSGVEVNALAQGISQLSKYLLQNDKASETMRRLGLNIDELIKLKPDEVFIQIGEAIAKLPTHFERSTAATEIFGRSGSQYLKVFTTNLGAMVAQIEETGPIIKQELIDSADEFDRAWERGKLQMKGFASELIQFGIEAKNSLGPVRGELVDSVKSFINYASAGNSAEDALANVGAASWKTAGQIKAVGISSFEAQIQAAKFDEQIKKTAEKTLKDHEEAAAKAAATLRDKLAKETEAAAAAYARLNSEIANLTGMAQREAALVLLTSSTSDQTQALQDLVFQSGTYIEEQFRMIRNESDLTGELTDSTQATTQNTAAMEGLAGQLITNREKTIAWQTEMHDLGQSFVDFAQISGDSLGKTFRQIGQMVVGIELAGKSLTSLTSGFSALGSGSILKGLTGIVGGIGGIASAAAAAVQLITSLWHGLQRLFGGGEEGVVVNPARDSFIGQYGGNTALGEKILNAYMAGGATYEESEAARIELMDRGLYAARTKSDFDRAQDAIIDLVGGQRFHGGGLVPGGGDVMAWLQGGERVLSREQNRLFGHLMDAIPSFESRAYGGGAAMGKTEIVVHNYVQLDGRTVAQSTARYLPDVLAVQGIR